MASRLAGRDERAQAGVINELLVSEILDGLYARVDVEPTIGRGSIRPDFRVHDDRGNTVIVEATNYNETTNEIHNREVLWNSIVFELREIVRPLSARVIVRPVGVPQRISFEDHETRRVRSAIYRAIRTGEEVGVPFGCDFVIGVAANTDASLAGKAGVLHKSYEHDGGVIPVPAKLRQIRRKVEEKAKSYSAFPRPLVVVMNCTTAFAWYDEPDEIEPLKEMMRDLPCDAVWLFCNLQPANIGFCEHHLLENPQSEFCETDHLTSIREARGRPLYEVLGLGGIWNRLVAFDRSRTPNPPATCESVASRRVVLDAGERHRANARRGRP